jgi:hypothetical protein
MILHRPRQGAFPRNSYLESVRAKAPIPNQPSLSHRQSGRLLRRPVAGF